MEASHDRKGIFQMKLKRVLSLLAALVLLGVWPKLLSDPIQAVLLALQK